MVANIQAAGRVPLPGFDTVVQPGMRTTIELRPQRCMCGPYWFGLLNASSFRVLSMRIGQECLELSSGSIPGVFLEVDPTAPFPAGLIPVRGPSLSIGSVVRVDLENITSMPQVGNLTVWGNEVSEKPYRTADVLAALRGRQRMRARTPDLSDAQDDIDFGCVEFGGETSGPCAGVEPDRPRCELERWLVEAASDAELAERLCPGCKRADCGTAKAELLKRELRTVRAHFGDELLKATRSKQDSEDRLAALLERASEQERARDAAKPENRAAAERSANATRGYQADLAASERFAAAQQLQVPDDSWEAWESPCDES